MKFVRQKFDTKMHVHCIICTHIHVHVRHTHTHTVDSTYQRRLLDYYQLGDTIGNGGFGAVYAGMCKTTGQSVSIILGQNYNVICYINHNIEQLYVPLKDCTVNVLCFPIVGPHDITLSCSREVLCCVCIQRYIPH